MSDEVKVTAVNETAETEKPKKKTAKTAKKEENLLKITLVKSTIGTLETHKRTVEALGLKKIRSFVIRKDSPALQGMIYKVKHLVKVEKA